MLKNPYTTNNETIAQIYQHYVNDPDSIMHKNGAAYYKVIQLFQLSLVGNKTISIAVLDNKMQLRLNDELVDENENCFQIVGFEMFRLSTDEFPDWYLKISFVSIEGDINALGSYLAKMK